jgi:hypothetical protein
MPGMDMSGHDMSGHTMSNPPSDSSGMKDMPGMDAEASAPAMHSMEGHHMDSVFPMVANGFNKMETGETA